MRIMVNEPLSMRNQEPNSSLDESRAQIALSQLVKTVGTVISDAREIGHVTCSLHLLASILYTSTLEPAPGNCLHDVKLNELVSTCKDEAQLIFPNREAKEALRELFYKGSSFSAVAKLLLFRVAADWLPCFSSVEQIYLFDSFFTFAPPSESLMALVPALTPDYTANEDSLPIEMSSICAVAERLLILCLIQNGGLTKMALHFVSITSSGAAGVISNFSAGKIQTISTLAQLIASIPDRARPKAAVPLHSPSFYLIATSQLLEGAKQSWTLVLGCSDKNQPCFMFIGEVFSRFCRRGHADIVASQMLPSLVEFIENPDWRPGGMQGNDEMPGTLINVPGSYLRENVWMTIIVSMKDVHALERLVKALLLEMAHKKVKDHEAYAILCLLFSDVVATQNSIRALFRERFLLWTVLPTCCLKWILHFVVLCCPPGHSTLTSRPQESRLQLDVIRHLVDVWAGESFVQSYGMEQQAYITAAVGLCLRGMTKEDLESSGNLLQILLQGISRRLESPLLLVRTMAKRVALAFSLVIDKAKPLLLDEDDTIEDLLDWEQLDSDKRGVGKSQIELDVSKLQLGHKDEKVENEDAEGTGKQIVTQDVSKQETRTKKDRKSKCALEAYDPDEVIDLKTYASESYSDEDTSSDSGSETSLQPYDLCDDESDLEKEKAPVQLSDCAADLRKGDEPDVVARALYVSEKLVRAMPDELENAAPELAHALIHVRCSAIAVEGQEESAEDKRQSALVALLVCAPQTVRVFAQELYSPHVDISQRLLILEVMSHAARELATGSSLEALVHEHNQQLIQEIDVKWYGPGGKYPPLGAGPWKELIEPDSMVSLIHKYERKLPKKTNSRALGKSRVWGHRSMLIRQQQRNQAKNTGRRNLFVPFAASFMLPVMLDYDKKRHGVDLLGRDFVVLGRLIYMLGVCIECVSLHPEASILAAHLLNMLRSRQISNHPEAYVRRAILYAASRIMVSLHPLHVSHAVSVGDFELTGGLDWIRVWALQVAQDDPDTECSSMAMACLHLHSELALQASWSMNSEQATASTAGNIIYKHEGFDTISFK